MAIQMVLHWNDHVLLCELQALQARMVFSLPFQWAVQ